MVLNNRTPAHPKGPLPLLLSVPHQLKQAHQKPEATLPPCPNPPPEAAGGALTSDRPASTPAAPLPAAPAPQKLHVAPPLPSTDVSTLSSVRIAETAAPSSSTCMHVQQQQQGLLNPLQQPLVPSLLNPAHQNAGAAASFKYHISQDTQEGVDWLRSIVISVCLCACMLSGV